MKGESEGFLIWIHEEDLCAVMSENGELAGIWGHTQAEVMDRADEIQEWMSAVMRNPEHKHGIWVWRINRDGQKITGEYKGERDDEG